MDTRASSKVKMDIKPLDVPGSDQDGKHLLGPSPGNENEDVYDLEEEGMRRDVSTEELKKKKEDEDEGEILTEEPDSGGYVTPHQGIEVGVTTRPTPVGLDQGSTAGGGAGGIMTKKFAISDEEMLLEEERRLALEVRHYEIMLKRAQVESMKDEIDKLSLKKSSLNVSSGSEDGVGRVVQARRREMLKVVVPDFKRGDADEALNSIANFNVVLKACDLESVAYLEKVGSADEETDLGTLVRRLVSKDFEIVASMRAEFGERGGLGSEMMRHLRDNFVDPLVYESSDAETELLKVDWQRMMEGDGTKIKASLDKVWAITKLMPDGRQGTDAGWIKYVLDRTPAVLAVEYYRQLMAEPVWVQQKAAKSTRSFAVLLAKARNNVIRRESIFDKDEPKGAPPPLLTGEPPHFSMHEKKDRDKGCSKCYLFGCAKAFDDNKECDIFGMPTVERVAKIARNEKYKAKVDDYRKEKKQEALVYAPSSNVHEFPSELLSNEEYAALVESLIDEEDDVEAEFSMYKCAMIKDGTYYAKAAE